MSASVQKTYSGSHSKTPRSLSVTAAVASRAISDTVLRGIKSIKHGIATEITAVRNEFSSPHRAFYALPEPVELSHHEEERSTRTFSWDASLLASSASMFWVLLDVLVKLNPSIPPPKLFFHFSIGIFVGSMTLMAGVAEPYGPLNAQPLLFMRSVCVTVALFARIFSLRFMTVVDSFTVSSLGPVLAVLPECQKVGRRGVTVGRSLAVVMAAVAISLVIYSKKYISTDAAATRRFAAGVVLTIAASVLRATVRHFKEALWHVPSVVQAFHTSFVGLIASCCLVVLFDNMHHLYDEVDMGAMVFLAQVGFAYNFSLTKAHSLESFDVVNILVYTLDAFFSMEASRMVLEEQVDSLSYFAAALVMGAVLMVEVYHVTELHPEKYRNQIWFVVLTRPLFARRPQQGDENPEPEPEVVGQFVPLNWRSLPEA